ncbi:hypothetical protein CON13_00255 [Bacillus cereus]|nr:hypothetical protein AT278_23320 [Bacillus cereus]PED34179.1 hypothetical protein CON13_00255 [Bacillus cereus]PEE49592.1 hypothetical protein COM80_30235 [Bacillus cereus]PEV56809.1 hypothetical protein CN422_19800 [Bacillus cereus]PFL90291.1 hypothetical protein COJ35_25735 [Bacillus cereus]
MLKNNEEKFIKFQVPDIIFTTLIIVSALITFRISQYLYITYLLLGTMFIFRGIRDFKLNKSKVLASIELILGFTFSIYILANHL